MPLELATQNRRYTAYRRPTPASLRQAARVRVSPCTSSAMRFRERFSVRWAQLGHMLPTAIGSRDVKRRFRCMPQCWRVARTLLRRLSRQAVLPLARTRSAQRGEDESMRTISKTIFTSLFLITLSAVASADDAPVPAPDGTTGTGTATPGSSAAPTASADLPAAKSDHDVQPEVASPGVPSGGIVSQAGVGGVVGYGRAGVLELGGSAGFAFASDYRSMNLSPTVGWFVADNLEVSAILSVANIKTGDNSSTLWSALAEPSYHVPFNRSIFGFLGLGIGGAHVSGLGTGFAVAPRIGANFMVGRSAVLTPSLSYQYTSIGTDMMGANDVTVVALTSAVRFNIGYTAMW